MELLKFQRKTVFIILFLVFSDKVSFEMEHFRASRNQRFSLPRDKAIWTIFVSLNLVTYSHYLARPKMKSCISTCPPRPGDNETISHLKRHICAPFYLIDKKIYLHLVPEDFYRKKSVWKTEKLCENSLKIFSTKLCGGTHYMQKRTISAFSKTLKIKLLPLSAPK